MVKVRSIVKSGSRILAVAGLLLFSLPSVAQDIHFSQIDVNPILLNPAYSGFFNGTGRLGVTYRNQWASVGEAFETFAASAEVSLFRNPRHHNGLSLGAYAYSDRAGALHYGSTSATLALSYFTSLNSQNSTILSGAVELGVGQSGFLGSNADMYDPTEVLTDASTHYPLVGAGVALFIQPHDDLYFKIGLSGRNLNRPNISYLGLADAYIFPKYNLYFRSEYRAWSNAAVLPILLVQRQNNNQEYVVGTDFKWYISESREEQLSVLAGARYRVMDAVYTEFAFEYNSFLLVLNYDVNLSALTPASRTIGAFEMSLVYRINTNKSVHRKSMPCPVI